MDAALSANKVTKIRIGGDDSRHVNGSLRGGSDVREISRKILFPDTEARPASFYFFYLGMQNGVPRFRFEVSMFKFQGSDAQAEKLGIFAQTILFRTYVSRIFASLMLMGALLLGGCAPDATRSASARAAYSMPGYGAPQKSRKVKKKKYKKPKTVKEKSKSGREAAKYRRESLSF
jgi:hypothetical protein